MEKHTNLNIAILQMNVQIGEPEKNFLHAIAMMERAMKTLDPKPDVLVLPETLNTGFAPGEHLYEIADKDGERAKELFSAFAAEHHVNIVAGSVTTLKESKLYNTSYAFNRRGHVISEYDKIHVFSPYGENDFYESGNLLSHFYLDGIPCAHMICYDLRFPELARSYALEDAKIFFVPAEWPMARLYPWSILTRARAIENQVYLVAVNGCGLITPEKPEVGQYAGHSAIIDPLGQEVVALEGEEAIAMGNVDMEKLQEIRKKMAVVKDRRPDVYTL